MKLKTSYYYQLSEHRNAVAVFYIIIILVMAAAVSFSAVASQEGVVGIQSGFDGSSMVFLFIAGMCSFTDEFLFLMQNGISRKTILFSRILAAMSLCAIMASVDKILSHLMGAVALWADKGLKIVSITEQIFTETNIFFDLMLTFSIYLSWISIGYVMAISYYRLNGSGRKLVGVGFIGTFLAVSVLDTVVLKNVIVTGFVNFLDFAYGITAVAPINAMITSFCIFLLCSLASYLIIRRVPVKE